MMKINEIEKMMHLSDGMINIFTDYAFSLDKYFSLEENRKNHDFLYKEYQNLNANLKELIKKNGFDK